MVTIMMVKIMSLFVRDYGLGVELPKMLALHEL